MIEKGNLIEVINIILKKTENKIIKEGEWIIWCWVITFELNFNDIWLGWAKKKMGHNVYEGNCVIELIFWCKWWRKKKLILKNIKIDIKYMCDKSEIQEENIKNIKVEKKKKLNFAGLVKLHDKFKWI